MLALLVLPDGREIFSGQTGAAAITSLTLTAGVNDSQELTLGSACAAMVEAELLIPQGEPGLAAGEELTLYWVDEGGVREKAGIFIVEKPEKTGESTWRLTGYDRVCRLDRDVTGWLEGLQGWPYSLLDFGKMVSRQCGVELQNSEIPNGDYQIAKFSARGITGRQLLFWVGEIAGRFLRATPEGTLLLDWYTPAEVEIAGAGENFYYQDTLSYSDYQTAPIERVQLRFNEEDVGTIYPPEAAGNTYAITGNFLLTAENAQSLLPVAQTLYEQLSGVQYTPCKLTVPARLGIRAGQILRLLTPAGETITVYVMERTTNRGRDILECTGSPTRDSAAVVNSQSYKALTGKILRLGTDVDGLTVENRDMQGKMAGLTLDVAGIRTEVSRQQTKQEELEEKQTLLEQNAGSISLSVKEIRENGVSRVETETGYTFDKDGMRISKSGQAMENRLDNTGMYVTRSGEEILTANNQGVQALNLTARQYLVAGQHARFEDYPQGRTACFWI